MNQIEKRIRELITEISTPAKPIETWDKDDRLVNIGVDSLSLIKLIAAIEQEFNVDFDDEGLNIDNYDTLSQLITYVEGRIATKNRA